MKKLLIITIFILLAGCTVKDNKLGQTLIGGTDIFSESKMEGWGRGLYTAPEYDGDDMPMDALVVADNIEFGSKKSIAPRRGTIVLGTESSNAYAVKSMHTANSLDGRELLIRTATTTIDWYNDDADEWETLDTGYTNGQEFSFADGMISTDTANYTYFSNGTEGIRRFRVAFGSVASNASTTLTLNSVTGFDSADDIGFNTSGTITTNGSDYTYSGITGWQLTGLSALPALSVNEGVISTVETTGFTDAPTSSVALVIKDQRLYAAYKNTVFCSHIDDFRNFGFSAPRVASQGEQVIFPEGGNKIDALAIRPDYVAVIKKDYIGKLQFQDFGENLSDIPVVNTLDKEINIGAPSQKAVVYSKNNVIYSGRELGMTSIGRLEGNDYDSLSVKTLRIKPTIQDYDFSDSAVAYFDDKVLNSVNDGSNYNNKVIVYDTTYDRFTEFSNVNANAFATYNDKLYYGDALTDNVYQIFYNEYTDNALPFATEWKTKWLNFGYPANWKELGYIWVEGYLTKNTEIDFTIYLDEGGAYTSKTVTITGSGDYVENESGSGFGDNPFGYDDFGQILEGEDNLLHFGGFINTADLFGYKFRNVQYSGKTSGSDINYRITKIISYVNVLDKSYGQGFSELIIND